MQGSGLPAIKKLDQPLLLGGTTRGREVDLADTLIHGVYEDGARNFCKAGGSTTKSLSRGYEWILCHGWIVRLRLELNSGGVVNVGEFCSNCKIPR